MNSNKLLTMNFKMIGLALAIVVAGACKEKKAETQEHHHETKGQVPADTLKKSIPKEEHAMVGQAHITIKYHAPAVRGRVIWGGLVPYDQVWVTGAHSATSFEINKDFLINNQTIPAGKYALFTVPGKEKWEVIFNKNWQQHLTDEYDANDDVARFAVEPKETENLQERLYYALKPQNDNSAVLTIRWEKIEVSFPFYIKE